MAHAPRVTFCLLACILGAAPPARAQPVTAPRAAELFAALAAPDQAATTAQLRRAHDLLADGADANAIASARAQLELILARQAANPAPVPAVVMAALANRIDGALARLDHAADVGEDVPSPAAPWALSAIATLAVLQTVAILLGLALLARRLRGAARAPAVLARLDQLAPRLDAVLAHAATVPQDSAKQASLAIDRLEAASARAQQDLHSAATAAIQRLGPAEAQLAQIDRIAHALPALMGEAVGAVEGRGLPPLTEAMTRLEAELRDAAAAQAEHQQTVETILAQQRRMLGEALIQSARHTASAMARLDAAIISKAA